MKKAPQPKSVMVHKGIKGLLASGPGMKKNPAIANLHRPEGVVHIDAGNVKKGSGSMKTAAGSPKDRSMGSGHKGIHIGVRPEGAIKRDSASVVKP